MPLLFTYNHTKDRKFFDAAIASAEFAEKSMSEDGGWFRGYYLNGKTDSFGHATSGSACSAIFWMELYKVTGEKKWLLFAEKALSFCMNVQFANPSDSNLKGAILEKVLPTERINLRIICATWEQYFLFRPLPNIFLFYKRHFAYPSQPLILQSNH